MLDRLRGLCVACSPLMWACSSLPCCDHVVTEHRGRRTTPIRDHSQAERSSALYNVLAPSRGARTSAHLGSKAPHAAHRTPIMTDLKQRGPLPVQRPPDIASSRDEQSQVLIRAAKADLPRPSPSAIGIKHAYPGQRRATSVPRSTTQSLRARV
ncbi:hypothetical protein BD311DRAFT_719676 [Dichomitus squalens]|uniref:Secreted protein n=1 Tax=Dichomitus squalens TaxID=114155 RepID=A0A4Q9MPT5_9APHY|nr:hypothetical protein BD311DRAFT_719676 [Dichomitus squalens]